jgi:cytosine/uracil/thiamine/allantoin permease
MVGFYRFSISCSSVHPVPFLQPHCSSSKLSVYLFSIFFSIFAYSLNAADNRVMPVNDMSSGVLTTGEIKKALNECQLTLTYFLC